MKKKESKFEKSFDKFMGVYYIIFGVLLATTLVNVATGSYLFKVGELTMGVGYGVGMFLPIIIYGVLYKLLSTRNDIQTGNIAG